MASTRRTFGSVRKRASGRFETSYWWEGKRYLGPRTFETRGDANAYLSTVEADVRRGAWIDPDAGRERFGDYARAWLADRHDLRPRTRELYAAELSRHLVPAFGAFGLTEITTAKVRTWHAGIARTTPVTAAKCYRLLRTILATAVADGKLIANPCSIKRAGQERSPERTIPTVEQVDALADAVSERYRALVYTAAYGGLRLGECAALTRERIDFVHRTIAVTEQAQRVTGQGRIIGEPKSEAGKRVVAIPKALAEILEHHLARFVDATPTALVFTGEHGAPLERASWSARFVKARKAAGLDGTRFHDLRHFAGTTAAQTGATTRELMSRFGHSTPRAALIYQHATSERDHAIAAALDVLMAESKAAPVARVVQLPKRARPEPGPSRARPQRARHVESQPAEGSCRALTR